MRVLVVVVVVVVVVVAVVVLTIEGAAPGWTEHHGCYRCAATQ